MGKPGQQQRNTALTFNISISLSLLLEYFYRSILLLLKLPACIQYHSSYTSRMVVLRTSHGLMRKHDYANCAQLAYSPPSCIQGFAYMLYAYPAHCTMFYGLVLTGSFIVSNITQSWLSISIWYNIEQTVSNQLLPSPSGSLPLHSRLLKSIYESLHSLSHWYGCTCNIHNTPCKFIGGGKFQLTFQVLCSYVITSCLHSLPDNNCLYHFVSLVSYQNAMELAKKDKSLIVCRMPLAAVTNYLTLGQAKSIAKIHGVFVAHCAPLATIVQALIGHQCLQHCYDNVFIFKPVASTKEQKNNWENGLHKVKRKERTRKQRLAIRKHQKCVLSKTKRSAENKVAYASNKHCKFPPAPPSDKLVHKIITGFCKDTHPSQFQEAGCAVCGQLTLLTHLSKLDEITYSLDPLIRNGVTAVERKFETDNVIEKAVPILDPECHSLCRSCAKYLEKEICPPMALANGLWLGKILPELSGLTFVEKLLISCVRHNRCIVKVAAGRWKMRANAISVRATPELTTGCPNVRAQQED
jgi:hypothetical protein